MKIFLVVCTYTICILSFVGCQDQKPIANHQGKKTAALAKQNELSPIIETYHTDRAIWQKPELVLNTLGDVHDKVIADIGAGTGYFSFRLLPMTQKVIAVDIDPQAIQYLDSIASLIPEKFKSRFETRLATASDPKLMDGEVDIALLVNTYLYINDRVDYLSRLRSKLTDHGKVLIIDYKKKRIPIGPEAAMRIPLYQVEAEITKAGYTIVQSDDQSLSYQYILVARK